MFFLHNTNLRTPPTPPPGCDTTAGAAAAAGGTELGPIITTPPPAPPDAEGNPVTETKHIIHYYYISTSHIYYTLCITRLIQYNGNTEIGNTVETQCNGFLSIIIIPEKK